MAIEPINAPWNAYSESSFMLPKDMPTRSNSEFEMPVNC